MALRTGPRATTLAEAERQSLIAEGVIRGSLRDPVLGRAFLRRINLLDAPQAILDDPEVVQHAREHAREYYASRPPRRLSGPTAPSSSPPSDDRAGAPWRAGLAGYRR